MWKFIDYTHSIGKVGTHSIAAPRISEDAIFVELYKDKLCEVIEVKALCNYK